MKAWVLVGALVAALASCAGTTAATSTAPSTRHGPADFDRPATTTRSPVTTSTAATVTFTPTSRYVGFTFTSYEGEVPNTNGLRLLDWGCLDAPSCRCDGVWLVADESGPMLWITATSSPALRATVLQSFTVSAIAANEVLHFAQVDAADPSSAPPNGSILALVRGHSDATFRWTDLVAAWTISASGGGMISPRPTTGIAVFDACAAYRQDPNRKASRQCTAGS